MNKAKSFLLGAGLVILGMFLSGLVLSVFDYFDHQRFPDCWVGLGLGASSGHQTFFVCKDGFLLKNIWTVLISFIVIEIFMIFLWLKLSRKMKLLN